MDANEHYVVLCRNCGDIVEQCRCIDNPTNPRTQRYVDTCFKCAPKPAESPQAVFVVVDGRMACRVANRFRKLAEQGPGSRLQNVASAIQAAERPLNQAKGILYGMQTELEMVATRTSNPQVKDNYARIQHFAEWLANIDRDFDEFHAAFDAFAKSYK